MSGIGARVLWGMRMRGRDGVYEANDLLIFGDLE